MERIREKWDSMYNPWFTKIIAVIITFGATYEMAQMGPLSTTASLIAAAITSLCCLWNPGATAVLYIAVQFISIMHINAFIAGLLIVVLLIYAALGYASVSVMTVAPLIVMSTLPEGAYWGLFVVAIYFAYRCKEGFLSFLFPIFTAILFITFSKYGTMSFLYPDGFAFSKNTATDLPTFFDNVTFEQDSQYFLPNISLIAELTILFVVAGVIIWLVFRNRFLREKIKSLDICEAIMFLISIVVIILLDKAVPAALGIVTGTSYGAVIVSIIFGYIVTRPFASSKVAETLITRSTLIHRKDAALTFVAFSPKADWTTPYVNDDIKEKIKTLDSQNHSGIIINRDSSVSASYVADLIARHYKANMIKIDYDTYEQLYGEERETSFKKIFDDANAQPPVVICFNDADKFFYKVNEESGEYDKRYHRLHMEAISAAKDNPNLSVVLITDKPALIDETLMENDIINTEISYLSSENKVPEEMSEEEIRERDRQIRKKTNRAGAIGAIICILAIAGLLYYVF